MKFGTLIRRVRTFNPEAADYLRYEARKLPSFYWIDTTNGVRGCMIWDQTPQGVLFWSKVYLKYSKKYRGK